MFVSRDLHNRFPQIITAGNDPFRSIKSRHFAAIAIHDIGIARLAKLRSATFFKDRAEESCAASSSVFLPDSISAPQQSRIFHKNKSFIAEAAFMQLGEGVTSCLHVAK